MEEIIKELIEFRDKRSWQKYHIPRQLAESVSIEAGELLKCFQWGQEVDLPAVMDEVADVAIYLLYICEVFNVDIKYAIRKKIEKNAVKYPENERYEW